jgi:hypothetical protein
VKRLRLAPPPTVSGDVRPALFVGVYGFLRNSLRRCGVGDERKAEALRAPMQVVNHSLPIPRFIGRDAWIYIRQAKSQGSIEENRQLARCGRYRLRLTDSSSEPAIERAKGRLRFADSDCGSPQ